jgi:hypothetical protein
MIKLLTISFGLMVGFWLVGSVSDDSPGQIFNTNTGQWETPQEARN